MLLATKHKIWKVSALGDSAHEETTVAVQGKVVALDFDSKNVSRLMVISLSDNVIFMTEYLA